MKQFNLLNTILGWLAFGVAAVTYLLTIEPTASFWDCGEFISTAYRLDVGHPPGAPFFMLTGKFFSLFASDPTQVAMMINTMSALCSAFTILFLFWTITHLAQKVVIKSDSDYTIPNTVGILGAGMVGALAYTFSDTFWFSAVEGEVYAYSSLFTAVVFWLILKWEKNADNPGSDRWLILIAYLMGLSIGVHLLNLLTIPAIVLVYYFKKYQPTPKGLILTLLVSVFILAFVLYGLIPGFVDIAAGFELFFVNTLGCPFNTGVLVYILLTLGSLIWAMYETGVNKSAVRVAVSFILSLTLTGIPFLGTNKFVGVLVIIAMIAYFYTKKSKVNIRWVHSTVIMVAVMLIGYSSYSLIVIRSAANPPMDQNSPDNVFALKSYLNRDQYGDTPRLYGAIYSAPINRVSDGKYCVYEQSDGAPIYAPKPKTSPDEKDEYIIAGHKTVYHYNDDFKMFFPRMHSQSSDHIKEYEYWGKVKGRRISYDECGRQESAIRPTFGENLRFFMTYQVGFMYWRYFMWNFSGRQNDIQGQGEITKGNWITGIRPIDNALVGNQDNLPSLLANNKGRNVYFMLPLLLGILGIFFHINGGKKGVQGFWIVLFLFILTGLAIVVYLNQPPMQVRERDYAYAASFYAFSIWIGLGVLTLIRTANKLLPKPVAAIATTLLCLGVPTLMAQQNWDDHDRSGRTAARDFGGNYLMSTKPNAIIFTNGDNDTFPLWYNLEVEEFRTDVRVCNLSYLATDWYIDQMKRGAYKSEPLPISWEPKDYITGRNDIVSVQKMLNTPLTVKQAFDFVRDDDPGTKYRGMSIIPSDKLIIPVNADDVINSGTLPEERRDEIVPQIEIDLGYGLNKSELMVIEMLNENKWKRPMYFATTVGDSYYLGLKQKGHFELTGLAYQVLPIKGDGEQEQVNVDETYDNMMNKFRYGNVSDPHVYLDEQILRMCRTHRYMFANLIRALIDKGDSVRTLKALDYCNEVLPGATVGHDYVSSFLAEAYYSLGENEKGDEIMLVIANDCTEFLNWSLGLRLSYMNSVASDIRQHVALLNQALMIWKEAGREEHYQKYASQFEHFYNLLYAK
ncbi:MAG: DUF2723 domain-containing protein [Prevotellaceae bacterium]|nr:DUF2723 domain-containing protein [Prevotellaceae bacterium]